MFESVILSTPILWLFFLACFVLLLVYALVKTKSVFLFVLAIACFVTAAILSLFYQCPLWEVGVAASLCLLPLLFSLRKEKAMTFNSWQFLLFLPIVLLVYFFLPKKIKWIWLLLASYFFYMCWNPWLVFLILGTTLVTYLSAIGIEKTKKTGLKKFFLVIPLVVTLGMLFFFKYFDFLMDSIFDIVRLFKPDAESFALNLILPVGISFYTFQALSYVIDVYRGDIEAEHHFGYYALFLSYFPQLVAGPIERAKDLLPQLKNPQPFDKENFFLGTRLLLTGYFRKIVIADLLAPFINPVFAKPEEANGLSILLAGALFCFQIYGDFAGYSEIAMGSARIMGVHLSQNFDEPYLATSYRDYFRRWHITLNRWFRDYLYIPMGGNRKGTARKIFNTIVVFALCGLWHGANWTYLLWGLMAAFFVSIESLLRKPFLKTLDKFHLKERDKRIVYASRFLMFFIFSISAILFRSNSVSEAFTLIGRLFSTWNLSNDYLSSCLSFNGLSLGWIVIILLLLTTMYCLYPYAYSKEERLYIGPRLPYHVTSKELVIDFFLVVAIAFVWVYLLRSDASSQFAYFQF